MMPLLSTGTSLFEGGQAFGVGCSALMVLEATFCSRHYILPSRLYKYAKLSGPKNIYNQEKSAKE